MKLKFYTSIQFILILFIACLFPTKIFPQDKSEVVEPSIPIYIVCPYHEDSLRAAFDGSVSNNGSSIINKCDTLQQQIAKLSAEETAHFTWLYALIALLGTMNIVQLFSIARIKKELIQIKRLEHQQKLAAISSELESKTTSVFQDTLPDQELKETNPINRIRRPRKKKQ